MDRTSARVPFDSCTDSPDNVRVPLDDRENIFAKVDELSHELIIDYLREVKSNRAKEAKKLAFVDLGRRIRIVGGTTEAPPINVGLLFLHHEPWRFFPATQIDVVWFPEGRAAIAALRRSSGDRCTR